VLAAILAMWFAASLGDRLRAPAQGAPVTQSDAPLNPGVIVQR
jgi:hypothetical protein